MNRTTIATIAAALLVTATGTAAAATPATAACTTATTQLGYSQQALNDAADTRNTEGATVNTQKAARETAINAGNVEQVGQINVQLGSSTALYNSVDSNWASKRAQVVRDLAVKNRACR